MIRDALYERVFPRWEPPGHLRPIGNAPASAPLSLTWLGTAGFVVETKTTTLLIDPYVSRAPLSRVAGRRLVPDEAAIARWIPKRVTAVLCGHSHFDHLMDAPQIALLRSARIVGSDSTAAFARASGVPESRIEVVPQEGRTLTLGDVEVTFVASKHGKIFLGRVPAPGFVVGRPRIPARAWHYKMGGAFGLLLKAAGVTVYHNGSADLVDTRLEGRRADVLVCGLAGRKGTRDYVERLTRLLSPRVVVPTHHDAFFAPLEEGLRLLPRIDIEGFFHDVRSVAPRARIVTSDYGERVSFAEGASDAIVSPSF